MQKDYKTKVLNPLARDTKKELQKQKQQEITDKKILEDAFRQVFEETGVYGERVMEWIMRQTLVARSTAHTNNLIMQQNTGRQAVGNRFAVQAIGACKTTYFKIYEKLTKEGE